MTPEEFKEADRICAKALDRNLSDYDEKFVNDIADKLGKYGEDTYLTARQWQHLNTIAERYWL